MTTTMTAPTTVTATHAAYLNAQAAYEAAAVEAAELGACYTDGIQASMRAFDAAHRRNAAAKLLAAAKAADDAERAYDEAKVAAQAEAQVTFDAAVADAWKVSHQMKMAANEVHKAAYVAAEAYLYAAVNAAMNAAKNKRIEAARAKA